MAIPWLVLVCLALLANALASSSLNTGLQDAKECGHKGNGEAVPSKNEPDIAQLSNKLEPVEDAFLPQWLRQALHSIKIRITSSQYYQQILPALETFFPPLMLIQFVSDKTTEKEHDKKMEQQVGGIAPSTAERPAPAPAPGPVEKARAPRPVPSTLTPSPTAVSAPASAPQELEGPPPAPVQSRGIIVPVAEDEPVTSPAPGPLPTPAPSPSAPPRSIAPSPTSAAPPLPVPLSPPPAETEAEVTPAPAPSPPSSSPLPHPSPPATCGRADEPCCVGQEHACYGSLVCIGSICVGTFGDTCGEFDTPCCDGRECDEGLECHDVDRYGLVVPRCIIPGRVCGHELEECCPGQQCYGGGTCLLFTPSLCFDIPCGGYGQYCCDNEFCDEPYLCMGSGDYRQCLPEDFST